MKYKLLIFLIIVELVLVMLLGINKNSFQYKQCTIHTKDLIISHCSEDLNWVFKYTNLYDKIYLYTKCKKEIPDFTKYNNIIINELPNSGQEVQTYLHHIIHFWDNLGDYNVFLTGNPYGKRSEIFDKGSL